MWRKQAGAACLAGVYYQRGTVTGKVLLGMFLGVVAFLVLGFNETRAVRNARVLQEAGGAPVRVAPDHVDPGHEGELVLVTGVLHGRGVIKDPETGFSTDSLTLLRRARHFQPPGNKGDSHAMSPLGRLADAEFSSPRVYLGAFQLPAALVSRISVPLDYRISSWEFRAIVPILGKDAKLVNGRIFVGMDPSSPQPGDVSIWYRVVPSGRTVTVLARQSGKSIQP